MESEKTHTKYLCVRCKAEVYCDEKTLKFEENCPHCHQPLSQVAIIHDIRRTHQTDNRQHGGI